MASPSKLHVVLALNHSDNSKFSLQWAMDHFLNPNIHRVTLFTVVEPPIQAGYYYAASGAIYSTAFIDEAYQKATDEATATVREFKKVTSSCVIGRSWIANTEMNWRSR